MGPDFPMGYDPFGYTRKGGLPFTAQLCKGQKVTTVETNGNIFVGIKRKFAADLPPADPEPLEEKPPDGPVTGKGALGLRHMRTSACPAAAIALLSDSTLFRASLLKNAAHTLRLGFARRTCVGHA